MSWEELAAAPADRFQGKALALPPAQPSLAVSEALPVALSAACWRVRAPAELRVRPAPSRRLAAPSPGCRSVSAGMLDFPALTHCGQVAPGM